MGNVAWIVAQFPAARLRLPVANAMAVLSLAAMSPRRPPLNPRRKLAIASWGEPRENSIFGKMTVDATALLARQAQLREQTGERITVTHLVGKAIALALRESPYLNGRIVFSRHQSRDSIDVGFLVNVGEGEDLVKAKIERADAKTVVEIARELESMVARLRAGQDEDYNKSKRLLELLPTWLIRPMAWLSGFLTSALGIAVPALGLERFPFGSCVVTNVGIFGVDEAFAPPTPWLRVPLYFLLGTIREEPVAIDGRVEIRPQLAIMATIDHRFVDGYGAAKLGNDLRRHLLDPELLA